MRIQFCLLLQILFFVPAIQSSAQNVGIGTTEPVNKLEIVGNLLVNSLTFGTSSAPTPAQTVTMVNGVTHFFSLNDSTGRVYDPGGPANPYSGSLFSAVSLGTSNCVGIEVTLENIDLGTGDSLVIKELQNSTDALLAVGNGYNVSGKWTFNSPHLYFYFKSNGDAVYGNGFSLLFRRIYTNPNQGPGLSGFVGKAMFFDATTGVFRAGHLGNGIRGIGSAGFGSSIIASGENSFATGTGTQATNDNTVATGVLSNASGPASVAMGYFVNASGINSVAMGRFTVSSNDQSVAFGNGSIASGVVSTAIGQNAEATGGYSLAAGLNAIASGSLAVAIGSQLTASGDHSMALGNYVSTSGFEGCLTIGDHSTTTVMNTFVANGFRSRFAGGYRLFTNSAANIGAFLNANANSWAALSDVRLKENFLSIDGEEFLKKISTMPLTTWNYIGQDAKTLRHYGPMAQDFYNAFGRDGIGEIGCDTLINQQDFLGVNLVAIQALEKRTQKIESLSQENQQLRDQIQLLEKRLVSLEKRKRRKKSL